MTRSGTDHDSDVASDGGESDVPFDDLDRRLRDAIEKLEIDVQTPSPYNPLKHLILEQAASDRKIRRRLFELDRVLEEDIREAEKWSREADETAAREEAFAQEQAARRQEAAADLQEMEEGLRRIMEAARREGRQEALAQMPKPQQARRPRVATKQIERTTGKTVSGITVTRDAVAYTFGEATEQQSDTDREIAEFEARHGKA